MTLKEFLKHVEGYDPSLELYIQAGEHEFSVDQVSVVRKLGIGAYAEQINLRWDVD